MDALGKRLVRSHLYGRDSGRLSHACNNAIGLSTVLYVDRLHDIYRVMRNYALTSRIGETKSEALGCSRCHNARRAKRVMKRVKVTIPGKWMMRRAQNWKRNKMHSSETNFNSGLQPGKKSVTKGVSLCRKFKYPTVNPGRSIDRSTTLHLCTEFTLTFDSPCMRLREYKQL